MKRRLAAIFAADVVAYSRLMGEDEAGTLARLKSLHKELVQPRISGGRGHWSRFITQPMNPKISSAVMSPQEFCPW